MNPFAGLAMYQIRVGDLAAAVNAIAEMEAGGADAKTLAVMHGRVSMRRHDWTSAFDHFSRALAEDADDPETLLMMGMVLFETGAWFQAIEKFRAVIARNGWAAKAWLKLGASHSILQNHAEAWACLERAVAIAPGDPETQHGMGVMCSSLGIEDGAEHHFRKSLALHPGYAHAEAGLAFTLLRSGRWLEGWPHFEARWRIPSPAAHWQYKGAPLYTGSLEGLRGKVVLLRCEQGFGDSIQFARYIEPLSKVAGRVILETQSELKALFSPLPAQVIVHLRDETPPFDVQTSTMSLPLLFETTPDTVPPPARLSAEAEFGFAPPTVGLCWAGGPRLEDPHANAVDQRRSLRFSQMEPIVNLLAGHWRSLQREDLDADEPEGAKDWQDTANIVAGLDLVITADTAMAHLAASLGRPTWLLNRFDSCWRWGMTDDSTPWYSSMRIFRQPRLGDWDSVIRDVVRVLGNVGDWK